MADVRPERRDAAIDRIQQGLRSGDGASVVAISIARRFTSLDHVSDGNIRFENDEEFHPRDFEPTVSHLRRLRKISEVFEDELHIDVGHAKFTRIATTARQLSSIASVSVAANNLLRSSQKLVEEYEQTGSVDDVSDESYENFFHSSSIFLLECFLFTSPLNYQLAWRGTRFVNNQYLYHLRGLDPFLYRVLLSEVHYLIRGVLPAALRSSADNLADYLVWTGRSTLEILDNQNELSSSNILNKSIDTVDMFINFIQDTYEIGDDLISEIDPRSIVVQILDELREFINIKIPSASDLPGAGDLPEWEKLLEMDDLPDIDDLPGWNWLSDLLDWRAMQSNHYP